MQLLQKTVLPSFLPPAMHFQITPYEITLIANHFQSDQFSIWITA